MKYVQNETDAPLEMRWDDKGIPGDTGKELVWESILPGSGWQWWYGIDTIDWWENGSRDVNFIFRNDWALNPYRQTATDLGYLLSRTEKEFMTMPPFRVERDETGKLWVAYLKRSRSGTNYISRSRYLVSALATLWHRFHGVDA